MKDIETTHSRGQGMAEYALILVLVALVVIAILSILGPAVGNAYSSVMDQMEESTEGESSEEGTGNETPGECYSSLLISIMVGTMGTVVLISHFLPRRPAKSFAPL